MKKTLVIILLWNTFASLYAQEKITLFFEVNKYELGPSENAKLKSWIQANKEVKILAIHGFTDEDGTTGFNDTLAQKRVDAVYAIVKNQIKIRPDFKTQSFGEKFQQSKDKAANRKVILYYILPQDFDKEDEILGIKKQDVTPIQPPISYPEQLVFNNPDGSQSKYQLDKEFMQKMGNAKAGEKLKIDNLNFVINTFIVVNESKAKLYELLLVLQKNPSLKIEIQGHLCCSPKDKFDLSTQRAKSICSFLINNGIDKSRLSYKGFGSAIPIYPLPEKDESERAANRRVEVLIVSN